MTRRRLFKITLLLLGIPAGLLALAVVLLLAAGLWADSRPLPEALKRPPLTLESLKLHASSPHPSLPNLGHEDFLKLNGKDYGDYLKLLVAKGVRQESIDLYLKLRKRYEDEKIERNYEDFRRRGINEDQDPKFKTRLVAWLTAHSDYITQLRRLAHAGPTPRLSLREQQESCQVTKNLILERYPGFYFTNIDILNRNARILFLKKDYRAAIECLEDSFLLAENTAGETGMMGNMTMNVALNCLWETAQSLINDPEFPASELKTLIPFLERSEKKLLPPDRLSRVMIENIIVARPYLVTALETSSWNSPLYGWGVGAYPRIFAMQLSVGKKKWFIPRLDQMAANTVYAIYNRLHAAEALKNYDRWNAELAEVLKRPYAEVEATHAKWAASPEYQSFYISKSTIDAVKHGTIDRYYQSVANFHLIRLGIMWRADSTATLARRNEDFTGKPDHPWRDPFTEKPLQIDTASSPTLIWSAGPDLKYQHGARPRNTDDLVIRLPR